MGPPTDQLAGPDPAHPAANTAKTPPDRSRRGGGLELGFPAPEPSGAALRERQASTRRYYRMMRWAKWLLPIGAFAVLTSIFLSGSERGGIEDMLSAEEIARLGAGLRLESPRFAGRTPGGQPFVISAEAAEPDSVLADEIVLIRPEGTLTLNDGRVVNGQSEGGMMRRSAETLTLTGDVAVETDDGYRFETDSLTVDIAERGAEAPGPVTLRGPDDALLEAGRMTILRPASAAGSTPGATSGATSGDTAKGSDDPADAVILFQGGVRVLFTPAQTD
ncbi:MAG: LPS export ABC transporter periplasmic protein LptC [Pseudomonadota bacterium]